MKKINIILAIFTLFMLFPIPISTDAATRCPSVNQLVSTNVQDKKEVLKALETLVPATFGAGDYGKHFAQWEVRSAVPYSEAVGQKGTDKATSSCGEAVAEQSWVVNLYFPRWEGKSADAVESQIFVAKSKSDGWIVWYRNH